MENRIEQIVNGDVPVGIAYIPSGVEQQTSQDVANRTEELIANSQKTLKEALNKLYKMTEKDWDVVFSIASKVQTNLFCLWKSATASVALDPETMLPRIQLVITERAHRARFVHFFTQEEWQSARNSEYDSDRLVSQVIENLKEQMNAKEEVEVPDERPIC